MIRFGHAALALLLATTACNSKPEIAAGALQQSVAQSAQRSDLEKFYERLQWTSPWSEDAVRQLEAALEDRARHGLDLVSFMPQLPESATPEQRDVARTQAALAYSNALARGRVDPRALYKIYTIPRPEVDVPAGLARALQDGKLEQWFAGLAPRGGDYETLSNAYLAFRAAAAKPSDPVISTNGGTIESGEQDPRMPEIARQLAASGYLDRDPDEITDDARYTRQVTDAVKALQRDYGLRDDGVIGKETIALLNMGPASQARAVAVALERMRWLDRAPPATRIDVNIAATQLSYWRDGKLVARRKVIVGRPDKATPQLLSPMFRLVANPTWTVPKSIQTTEMADKGAAYFKANHMVEKDGWIVQQPGPKNALGMVKFDLKNDHAIYLHDTNARTLFARAQRQLSHGCVRVDDALGFATMIARDEGVSDQWEKARKTGEETFVPLPREIPVRLLYNSAFVAADGKVHVRTDPYDWDEDVAGKLGFAGRWRAAFRTQDKDIGP